MVRLAKQRGLRAEVTTNALLLDDELAAGLLEAGLDQLVVSIDGASAEAFGRVRSGASLDGRPTTCAACTTGAGPTTARGMRIGVEFVAMRSNIGELPGLGRLAAQLGATFIIVSNVLAYTPELLEETLYDHRASLARAARRRRRRRAGGCRRSTGTGSSAPRSARPSSSSGPVSFFGADPEATRSHCPFVDADACAVGWHGGVSPCPPLLHTYTCFVRGREKRMLRWEVGRLPEQTLAAVWAAPEYVAFRDRVRRFDFPPCTDCGCELAEANEEDCLGNPHPTCGDCLWARGVVRCA